MEIPNNFAYMFLNIGFGILWVVFFIAYPQTRKFQFMVSILAAPLGPVIECLYFRDYWYPMSLWEMHWGFLRILPEDLFFAFFFTGTTSMLAHMTGKKVGVLQLKSPVNLIGIGLASILVAIPIIMMGVNSIFATSISFLFIAGLIILIKRESWKYAMYSGMATTLMLFLIYIVSYYLVANIEEILKSTWFLYGHPMLGKRITNIPITEIVWGFSWGAMTGAVRNYLFG